MIKNKYIHLVADYGTGDLAFAEVMQRFKHLLPETEIQVSSTPAFSTLNTGFIISQLSLYNPAEKLFIYSNTAPRSDDRQKRIDNEGEVLKYAQLDNGVEICAVDAGYNFSFVKDHIKKFHLIKVENKGSQFRSRDFYPPIVANIFKGKLRPYLGLQLNTKRLPAIPANRIMHIDAYGNMKTTMRRSSVRLQAGQRIRIVINHIYQTGIYANGNFCVKSGDLAFAPGSSGGDNPFMEIFLRAGHAAALFSNPHVETKFRIETV